MNKGFAQAWDELTQVAADHAGVLVRDGHRFMFEVVVDGVPVSLWAEENAPRFGVRSGGFSVRCFNVASVEALLAVLPDMQAVPEAAPEAVPVTRRG